MLEAEREELSRLCRRLYESGILAGSEGNVSIRGGDDLLVITPSSRHKGSLAPEDMLVADMTGSLLEGQGRVTKEFPLHKMIYEARPDVKCIIHAHPVACCAYAIAGRPIPEDYLLQMKEIVGSTALAPYAPAGSRELVEAVRPFAGSYNTILLQNHGLLCCGKNPEDALCRCETAEHIAQSSIWAELLGNPRHIR